MHRVVRSVVAAALGGVALHASALNVDFLGFAHGSESVSFSLTSPNAVAGGVVGAGGFLTSVNGGPSFETYCVDLYQTIAFSDPAYAGYSLVPGSLHAFANLNANVDLGRLYAAGHAVNDSVTEAAFQIAVWEITYEKTGSTYDLASGSAIFSGGTAASSGALMLASSWLGSLGGGSGGVNVLENAYHQDVIYAPIPEPETYALMAAGLWAIGFMVRRRPHR